MSESIHLKITIESISDHQFGSIAFINSKWFVITDWDPGVEDTVKNVADRNLSSCITYILIRNINN